MEDWFFSSSSPYGDILKKKMNEFNSRGWGQPSRPLPHKPKHPNRAAGTD
jgi:hypothetical protein